MNYQLRQIDSRREHQQRARWRSGFTLVELLIAMSIFVILATLTVTAFQANNSDRVSAAAGTFRNALEGARSRAINSGQIRGLRLIQDPNDSRVVTSMIYVGAPGYDTGTGGLDWNSTDGWVFANSDTSIWEALDARDLIKQGKRIEIPANSGNWYTIKAYSSNVDMPGHDAVQLAGHFRPSQWNGSKYISTLSGTLSYRLELAPAILEGAEPITLPPPTCIDLDGSLVPGRPSSGQFSGNLDILFAPSGVVTGSLATAGVVVFRAAHIGDQILARGTQDPLTSSSSPVMVKDPENGHKAIGIYTQTGAILLSEINSPGDTNGTFNDELTSSVSQVKTAYDFIFGGQEANQ